MRHLLLLPGLALLLACSGGGGGSDADPTAVSQGVITRVGSVTVTGVDWNTDAAAFDWDGPDPVGELEVGMLVTVRGARTETEATAERIEYDPALVGPVTSVEEPLLDGDGEVRRLDLAVLGQPVVIEPGVTVLGSGIDIDVLDVDDALEISGLRAPDGSLRATRIDLAPPEVASQLSGVVEGTQDDIDAGWFDIGALEVGFDPSIDPGVAPGDFVEVKGTLEPGLVLEATAIELEPPGLAGDAELAEVEGIVSDFASYADFAVGRQPVSASSAASRREPATDFGRDGVRVEVEGRLDAGLLLGSRIQLRDENARIHAEIAPGDIDLVERTLTLLGVTVRVDAATRLVNADGMPFDFGSFAEADFLVVRGVQIAGGEMRATGIERRDPEGPSLAARVQGFTFSGPAHHVTLLGEQVDTDAETAFVGFPDDVDVGAPGFGEEDFYFYLASNPASPIEVEVNEATVGDETRLADEIELEVGELEAAD